MPVLVVTPPEPLVDIDLAKDHLRLKTPDEDGLITSYIAAASAWIDGPGGWLARSIATQVLELRGNVFGCAERLPYGPVSQIVQVKYVDPQGVEQTLDPATYQLVGDRLALAYGASWPSLRGDAEGVRVQYEAGSDEVPETAKQAVLLLVGHWFRNRSAINVGNIVNELPLGVEALLAPLRRFI